MSLVFGHFGAPQSVFIHHSVNKHEVWETRKGTQYKFEDTICKHCNLMKIQAPKEMHEIVPDTRRHDLVHC